MKIFELLRLPERKKAAQLDEALAQLVAERETHEARRDELRTALRTAPFDQPTKVPELRQQLRQMDDDLEVLTETIEETERRAQAAKDAEEETHVLAALDEGRKARDQLHQEAVQFQRTIAGLILAVDRMQGLNAAVVSANSAAGLSGNGLVDPKNRYTPMRVRCPNIDYSGLRRDVAALQPRVPVEALSGAAAKEGAVREAAE